ncbi:hypothetical protein CLV63_115190 [Murinocardiopsis flavida]|uniref:Uncharacterized protein n=1 Tax=Murinocardiopsis flavida TaxID=645275 RepID=A0A2P8DED3_9ACTN|nr:hypothetical protein CLV63_115190 [Murinocardiopsis flavida]
MPLAAALGPEDAPEDPPEAPEDPPDGLGLEAPLDAPEAPPEEAESPPDEPEAPPEEPDVPADGSEDSPDEPAGSPDASEDPLDGPWGASSVLSSSVPCWSVSTDSTAAESRCAFSDLATLPPDFRCRRLYGPGGLRDRCGLHRTMVVHDQ